MIAVECKQLKCSELSPTSDSDVRVEVVLSPPSSVSSQPVASVLPQPTVGQAQVVSPSSTASAYVASSEPLRAQLLRDAQELLDPCGSNKEADALAVDAILKEFIGDHSIRLCKKGISEASRDKMKQVISAYMSEGRPIPILIACAPCKLPICGRSLDLSEVIFLRSLQHLHLRVRQLYPPSFRFVLRFEDATLFALFPNMRDIKSITQTYTDSFRAVIEHLNASSFIEVRSESEIMSPYAFLTGVFEFAPLFAEYVRITDPLISEWKRRQEGSNGANSNLSPIVANCASEGEMLLESPKWPVMCKDLVQEVSTPTSKPVTCKNGGSEEYPPEDDELAVTFFDCSRAKAILQMFRQAGWYGGISSTFREWVRDRYRLMYRHQSEAEREVVMSRYLACFLVRRKLGGIGVNERTEPLGRLEISLVPPQPGNTQASTRVWHRSAPLHISRETAPFWRCQGTAQYDFKTGHTKFSYVEIKSLPLAGHPTQKQQQHIKVAGSTDTADYVVVEVNLTKSKELRLTTLCLRS